MGLDRIDRRSFLQFTAKQGAGTVLFLSGVAGAVETGSQTANLISRGIENFPIIPGLTKEESKLFTELGNKQTTEPLTRDEQKVYLTLDKKLHRYNESEKYHGEKHMHLVSCAAAALVSATLIATGGVMMQQPTSNESTKVNNDLLTPVTEK